MSQEGEPGGPPLPRIWPIVFGEDAPDDVLFDLDAQDQRRLMGDTLMPEARIASFNLEDGGNQLWRKTFGPRLAAALRC